MYLSTTSIVELELARSFKCQQMKEGGLVGKWFTKTILDRYIKKVYYFMGNILFSNSAYLEHDQNSNEQTTNEFRGTFRHEKDITAKN